jgi:hypothetical protein
MLESIIRKLPLKDIKSCRLVSPLWNQVIERSVHYNFPLSLDTMKYFRSREYKVNELKVHLDVVTIPTRLSPVEKGTVSSVKRLKLVGGKKDEIDGQGIRRLITSSTSLETLSFEYVSYRPFRSIQMSNSLNLGGVTLQNLRSLQVIVIIRQSSGCLSFHSN